MTPPLRHCITEAASNLGLSMKDLTVLSAQNDPFRVDTPARHRDGAWLAITAQDLGLGDRKIHLRGLHYMVIGRPKPDGTAYTNTDADWLWLSGHAGKAARWLGYLDFDQILDERNAAPELTEFTPADPYPYLSVGLDIDIPDADDLEPYVGVLAFVGTQTYKLVIFGEKSSLHPVLAPFAATHKADLYLPTGEISDTLLHQMASIGAADGRPMVVLCFSDCDPAGWQMPISIARKLQAFKTLKFNDLDFQVHRVALTPDQVGEYGLPSTPLKAGERRADRWRDAMGVEQTEIDALGSLQPDLLRQIVRDAIAPFYDYTLARRVDEAERAWLAQAQAVVDQSMDPEHLGRIQAEAAIKLAAMRDEVEAINAALQIDADDFDLPTPVVPAAQTNGDEPPPLLDSHWTFAEQSRRLIESKSYGGDIA